MAKYRIKQYLQGAKLFETLKLRGKQTKTRASEAAFSLQWPARAGHLSALSHLAHAHCAQKHMQRRAAIATVLPTCVVGCVLLLSRYKIIANSGLLILSLSDLFLVNTVIMNDTSSSSASQAVNSPQHSPLMSTSSPTSTLKRFDIIGQYDFIQDDEFSIDHFSFPTLTREFMLLDDSATSQSVLEAMDIPAIIRKVADQIGLTIEPAFHQMPPNGVLKDISKKFKREYPQAQINFDRLKASTMAEDLSKYKDISVCI